MADPHIADAFRELTTRGLIAPEPAPQPLPRGNVDRRDPTRSSWLVPLPPGGQGKLTLGRDLADLAARHAGLVQACPAAATTQLAHVRLPAVDALLESCFEGQTLASAVASQSLPPAILRRAVARIRDSLAATEKPSSESARAAEWTTWAAHLMTLPVWQPAEARHLEQSILPALYQRLAADPPVTRWTNGDFLPANILLNASGESRLVDAEFAARTHFFAEDAVRFRALSSMTGPQLADLASLVPDPGPAWHLYFWLRQLQLEVDHNRAEYVDRVRAGRLGVISRLAGLVLETALPGWSVTATEVHHRVEDARWSQAADFALRLTGWCHVPAASALRSIVATLPGGRRVAEGPLTPRPDVQQHFAGSKQALRSGFTLSVQLEPNETSVTLSALTEDNLLLPFHVFQAEDLPGRADFSTWAAQYDPDPPPPAAPASGPLFSILVPVYNPPLPFLTACIESVFRQHHPHWELCIVDDASTSPGVAECLGVIAAGERRVRLQTRAANGGISRATNDALANATGEFILLLDHDDLLRPHALAECARQLAAEPSLDAIYSDEDKITADGQRFLHSFKPDFSPEFLLGVMYVGHALCVRSRVARAAGGFDPTFDGVQDYEFFLRVTEHTRRIGHIPKILYHWRQSLVSSALIGNVKGDMDERQAAAVRAHLQRRGRSDRVIALGGHRVRLMAAGSPPPTEIFVPAGLPVPDGWQVVALHEETGSIGRLRQAGRNSHAEVIVLLTASPVVVGTGWLEALAAVAGLPDSGLVAPVLLARDGKVLESGWTTGPQAASPLLRGSLADQDGYNGTLACTREVAAVSPLCVAIRRDRLNDILVNLPSEIDWLDLCRRLHEHGLFNRVCASARVQLDRPDNGVGPEMGARPGWPDDGFFNPHFDLNTADYRLRSARLALPPRWHLDTVVAPVSDGYLHWRGWCAASEGTSLALITLRAGDLILSGVIGLPRPDVKAAVPDVHHDNTGFEIRGTLPGGRFTLSLAARMADGVCHQLLSREVVVTPPRLPRWLSDGGITRLMAFQTPTQAAYPARPVQSDRFPAPGSGTSLPKFSIVTPSYNQARFLPETMRSVLDQANVTCDYVVQDGGSNDGSAEYIASQAGRLRAWASESDAGQATAIARGFAKTAGAPDDLMAWINSDDFYLPGSLAGVAAYFAHHPEVDVIYGHRLVVNEQSQEIARWFLPRHDPGVLRLNDFVPQETLFWRRRIWDRIGGIDPALKFAMDWDLLLRFQAAGANMVRVPYFLACFRVHAAQKTSADMHDIGQHEISLLRERTHGRPIPAQELEQDPRLLGYLRRSAFIEFLWRWGIRAP